VRAPGDVEPRGGRLPCGRLGGSPTGGQALAEGMIPKPILSLLQEGQGSEPERFRASG